MVLGFISGRLNKKLHLDLWMHLRSLHTQTTQTLQKKFEIPSESNVEYFIHIRNTIFVFEAIVWWNKFYKVLIMFFQTNISAKKSNWKMVVILRYRRRSACKRQTCDSARRYCGNFLHRSSLKVFIITQQFPKHNPKPQMFPRFVTGMNKINSHIDFSITHQM